MKNEIIYGDQNAIERASMPLLRERIIVPTSFGEITVDKEEFEHQLYRTLSDGIPNIRFGA